MHHVHVTEPWFFLYRRHCMQTYCIYSFTCPCETWSHAIHCSQFKHQINSMSSLNSSIIILNAKLYNPFQMNIFVQFYYIRIHSVHFSQLQCALSDGLKLWVPEENAFCYGSYVLLKIQWVYRGKSQWEKGQNSLSVVSQTLVCTVLPSQQSVFLCFYFVLWDVAVKCDRFQMSLIAQMKLFCRLCRWHVCLQLDCTAQYNTVMIPIRIDIFVIDFE